MSSIRKLRPVLGKAINLTPYAVGELAGKDAEGMPLFVAVVKVHKLRSGE